MKENVLLQYDICRSIFILKVKIVPSFDCSVVLFVVCYTSDGLSEIS